MSFVPNVAISNEKISPDCDECGCFKVSNNGTATAPVVGCRAPRTDQNPHPIIEFKDDDPIHFDEWHPSVTKVVGEFKFNLEGLFGTDPIEIGGLYTDPIKYDISNISPTDRDEVKSYNFQIDASAYPSGRYSVQAQIVLSVNPEDFFDWDGWKGSKNIVNRTLYNEYGRGFWGEEYDYLVIQTDSYNSDTYNFNNRGVLWVQANGNTVWFEFVENGDNDYFISGAGDGNIAGYVLTFADGEYTITQSGNQRLIFEEAAGSDRLAVITARIDALGNTTSYSYASKDGDGVTDEMTSITYANGLTRTLTYGEDDEDPLTYGMIISETDVYGRTTDFVYNNALITGSLIVGTSNYLVQIIEPEAGGNLAPPLRAVHTYNYEADPNRAYSPFLKSSTDPLGNTTTLTYDSLRRVTKVEQSCGGELELTLQVPVSYVVTESNYDSETVFVAPVDDAHTEFTGIREDERGNQTYFRTDRFGQVVWEKDEYDTETIYERDSGGRIIVMIQADPDGGDSLTKTITINEYDSYGNPTSTKIYDENGYDVDTGTLIGTPTPLTSESWEFSDPNFYNLVTKYTNALGKTTLYTYGKPGDTYDSLDDDGKLLSMTQVIGTVGGSDDLVTTYTYTHAYNDTGYVAGLLAQAIDPSGTKTKYEYFSDGGLIEDTLPEKLGLVKKVTYAFDSYDNIDTYVEYDYDRGNVVTETKQLDGGTTATTTYVYDNLDRLIEKTDPDPDGSGGGNPLQSPVTRYEYNLKGLLTRIVDPLGHETKYFYDVRNRVHFTVESSPDVEPNPQVVDDVSGGGSGFAMPSGSGDWTYINGSSDGYGGDHHSSNVTGATATWTQTGLDNAKYYQVFVTWQDIGLSSGQAQFTVNSNEDEIKVFDQSYYPWEFFDGLRSWNSLGVFKPSSGSINVELERLAGTVYADAIRIVEVGPVTETVYNCVSDLTSETDPLGRTTTYTYDKLNRLETATGPDPDGNGPLQAPITKYFYNSISQLIETKNELGFSTFYKYDQLGRLIETILPDPDHDSGTDNTPTYQSEYNAAGQLISTTDALGNITKYIYDDLGRRTFVVQPIVDDAPIFELQNELDAAVSSGTWYSSYSNNAQGNDYYYSFYDPSPGSRTWEFDDLDEDSSYEVFVSWNTELGSSYNSDNVRYDISDGITTKTYYVSQKILPNDEITDDDGREIHWHRLDFVGLTGNSLTITVYGASDGLVVFDAARVEKVGAITQTTYDSNGNVSSTIDANGNTTLYRYDALDRRVVSNRIGEPGLTQKIFETVVPPGNYEDVDFTSTPASMSVAESLSTFTLPSYTAASWTGAFLLPASSSAAGFSLSVAGGGEGIARVFIDNIESTPAAVLEVDSLDPTNTVSINLKPGYHTIRVEFICNDVSDGAYFSLLWDPTGGTSYGNLSGSIFQTITEKTGYDLGGRLTNMTDANGQVTTFEYDNLGRQTKTILADPDEGPLESPEYSTAYDANGNVIQTTDALGHITVTHYDNLDRPTETLRIGESGLWGQSFYSGGSPYSNYPDFTRTPTSSAAVADLVMAGLPAKTASRWFGAVLVPDGATYVNFYLAITSDGMARIFIDDTTTPFIEVDSIYNADEQLIELTSGYHTIRVEYVNMEDDNTGSLQVQWDTSGSDDFEAIEGLFQADRQAVTYDAVGQVLTTTDALYRTTTYTYDDLGRRISVTLPDPDGTSGTSASAYTTVYNAAGQVVKTVDALGNKTYYEYDDLGRQIEVIQPPATNASTPSAFMDDEQLTNIYFSGSWDPVDGFQGNAEVITKSGVSTATYTFDVTLSKGKNYQLFTTWDPGSDPSLNSDSVEYEVIEYEWNGSSHTPHSRGSFYANQQLTPEDDVAADGGDGALWHRLGKIGTEFNANSSTTTASYIRVIVKTSGSSDGRIIADGFHFVEIGATTSAEYDKRSQVTASTDEIGRVTTYDYDNLGRTVLITSPDPDGLFGDDAPSMAYTYDSIGNVLTQKDGLDHGTTYVYDTLNRLISSTNANDEETTFTYDSNGSRKTLTDPNGNVTEWFYDNLNRVIEEKNALGLSRYFEYNDNSQIIKKTLRNENVIEYTYDSFNRLHEEKWGTTLVTPTTQYTFDYDVAGQLLNATDAGSANDVGTRDDVYAYDGMGRVINETTVSGLSFTTAHTRSFLYQFDENSRLGAINEYYGLVGATPISDRVYSRDNLGRISRIRYGDNNYRYVQADMTYNSAGQFDSIERHHTGNLFVTSSSTRLAFTKYSYDGTGRLENLKHATDSTLGTLFAEYGYTWDVANRITNMDFIAGRGTVSNNEDVDYEYDDANQVKAADRASGGDLLDEEYFYDDNGNRVGSQTVNGSTQTYGSTSPGDNNQLLNDGIYAYTYDDEGNRLTRTVLDGNGDPTGVTEEYVWDNRNRLIEVKTRETPSGDYTHRTRFTYDYQNYLVSRIEDMAGDGTYDNTTFTSYWWHEGEMIASEVIWYGTGHNFVSIPGSSLVLFDISDEVRAPLGDHLNTVRDVVAMVDIDSVDTPVVVEHNAYDSFGRVWFRETLTDAEMDTWSNVTGEDVYDRANESVSHVGYTGQYFEISTGLQYNHNRWYDAKVGKWISEDPIGFEAGDTNVARYVENNPIHYVDPDGTVRRGGFYFEYQEGGFKDDNQKETRADLWWGANAKITYHPDSTCGCKNIALYQIVRTEQYQLVRRFKTAGYGLKSGVEYYYQSIDEDNKINENFELDKNRNSPGAATNSNGVTEAILKDRPGLDGEQANKSTLYGTNTIITKLKQFFETGAVCIDKSSKDYLKSYGTILWSHEITRNKKSVSLSSFVNGSVLHQTKTLNIANWDRTFIFQSTQVGSDDRGFPSDYSTLDQGYQPSQAFIDLVGKELGGTITY